MTRADGALVLLVDDDATVVEAVAELLEIEGYRVAPYCDPVEALEADVPQDVALLLTDVAMPQLTGPALAREVARRRPLARTLFMSALPLEMAVERYGLDADAPFLPKPFTRAALAAACRAALS